MSSSCALTSVHREKTLILPMSLEKLRGWHFTCVLDDWLLKVNSHEKFLLFLFSMPVSRKWGRTYLHKRQESRPLPLWHHFSACNWGVTLLTSSIKPSNLTMCYKQNVSHGLDSQFLIFSSPNIFIGSYLKLAQIFSFPLGYCFSSK